MKKNDIAFRFSNGILIETKITNIKVKNERQISDPEMSNQYLRCNQDRLN